MSTLFLPGKKKKGPESEFKAAVTEYIRLRHPRAWFLPVRGGIGQRPGVPDLLFCINGIMVGIELKNPSRPTSLRENQQREMDAIRAAGGIAGRVASWEELDALLGELDKK